MHATPSIQFIPCIYQSTQCVRDGDYKLSGFGPVYYVLLLIKREIIPWVHGNETNGMQIHT